MIWSVWASTTSPRHRLQGYGIIDQSWHSVDRLYDAAGERWSGHDRKLAVRPTLNDRLTSCLTALCQLPDEIARIFPVNPCQASGWLGGASERWLRVNLITCAWLSAHVE